VGWWDGDGRSGGGGRRSYRRLLGPPFKRNKRYLDISVPAFSASEVNINRRRRGMVVWWC
jgi:hypothetical protein